MVAYHSTPLAGNSALPVLRTPRLVLDNGTNVRASELAAFHSRNLGHFARWDPPTPPDFATVAVQARRIDDALTAFAAGSAYRWWLLDADAPRQVIGAVNFSQVMRGAFHSCMLGYSLDLNHTGRGLMHEALTAAMAEIYSRRVNLHRIQANYRPENRRSGAVLDRLGFGREGLAPRYLYIDGAWRDHVLTAHHNPDFVPPPSW